MSIAKDMIEGSCCQLCGSYFDSDSKDKKVKAGIYVHGYPVVCWDCWPTLSKEHKAQYIKAEVAS